MIAMDMADKDIIDFRESYLIFPELHLCAFTTFY